MTRQALVHVIDDDGAARDSLAFLLEMEGFTVKTYESAVAFVDAWPSTEGDCIVTDVRMPEMDGIALLRHLRTQGNDCPVIVVTGRADIPLAIEAISSGAYHLIEKPFDADVLLSAVHAALDLRGGVSTAEQTRRDVMDRLATLSDREREVFDRIARGHSNGAMAEDLGLSERSVEIHRANVMTKMSANGLPDLVRMALTLK